MPYIGKTPADIIATAVDTTTGKFSGAVTVTTADNNAQLTLTSTDADAAVGPVLEFNRNSASAADSDLLGRLSFIGKNDADEDVDYGIIRYKITDASNGTEASDIAVRRMVAGTSTNILNFKTTETIFNEDSADLDFRVESNDSANMLFVNGGNNQVGIGVDAASTVFHVETSTDGTGVSGDEIYVAKFYNREATDSRSYGVDIHAGSNSTDQALRCKTHDGGTQLFLVKGDGSATIANGLTLTDGNLVVANGHGIDFSATSDGTTMSSELLDDYEEGSYDVTITCGGSGSITLNSSFNSAAYTKIGRVVHVHGLISASSVSSPVGFIGLSLPFTPANLSERIADAVVPVYVTGVASANVADFVGTINENDARIFIQLGDAASAQNDAAQQIQASTNIMFSGTYITS